MLRKFEYTYLMKISNFTVISFFKYNNKTKLILLKTVVENVFWFSAVFVVVSFSQLFRIVLKIEYFRLAKAYCSEYIKFLSRNYSQC